MVSSTQMVCISPEESTTQWGLKKGRTVTITGTELTDEKVKLLMKSAALYLNYPYSKPQDAKVAFESFKKFCQEQNAEVAIR